MISNHIKQSITGWEPSAHDGLEERLAFGAFGIFGDFDVEFLKHFGVNVFFVGHDRFKKNGNGLENELAETTFGARRFFLGPFFGLGIEKVFAPETFHEFFDGNAKFGGVHLGKRLEGETPGVEAGTEADGALFGFDLNVAKNIILVGGNDDVGGFDGVTEVLVAFFGVSVQFEENTIKFVDKKDGFNAFSNGLTKDSFRLDAHAFDAINDDKSTVCDTKGGCDFRRKIDVPGGINQVDQKFFLFAFFLFVGAPVEKRHGRGFDGN